MGQEDLIDVYKRSLLTHAPRVPQDNPYRAYYRMFLQREGLGHDARILDAGCGNGAHAFGLASEGFHNIVGIDLFDSLDTKGAFQYARNSIDHIDLPDNSVDFAYSLSVLYHLPEPSLGFRELFRVLKPGAMLIFTAHTRFSLWTLDRRIKRCFGGAANLRDTKFRSAGQFVEICKEAGFEVLDVNGVDCLYTPFNIANIALRKLFWRGHGPSEAAWVKRFQQPQFLRRIRSVIGYHMIIALRKPPGSAKAEPHMTIG